MNFLLNKKQKLTKDKINYKSRYKEMKIWYAPRWCGMGRRKGSKNLNGEKPWEKYVIVE